MLTYVDVTLSLINLKAEAWTSNIFKVIYVVGTGTIISSYFTHTCTHSHCMGVINIGT